MTQERSVTSQVEVSVDAQTAFRAFTEEMNYWWVRGPINFYDASRAVAKVCEPGVGGRILEVYDAEAGDALEVGRITDWQPGELLAFNSSVDDVRVAVSFTPVAAGTLVRVIATIPADGADRGGTAWVRVTPAWFGAWCQSRNTAPRAVVETNKLAVAVYYAKPVAAAHWLAQTFGFAPTGELPAEESTHGWIEFRVGHSSLIILGTEASRPEGGSPTHVPWIFVDDLDAHYAAAVAGGASIVQPITQHGYRGYVAADLEGQHWSFAQARPTQLD